MKLYTEDQVREMLDMHFLFTGNEDANDYIESMTPIELPSDEEVEETFTFYPQIIEGAKWVIEQIKQQAKSFAKGSE